MSRIENLKCTESAIIIDALSIINTNGKGIIFVVDDSNKLLGIMTDGDIRRALLNNAKLNESIKEFYNNSFTYATTVESAIEKLKKLNHRVQILPVIDENFILVDYFQKETLYQIPISAPSLRGNEFKYLVDAFLSTWISSTGSYIEIFEANFAAFCEAKHGVAVSNGTVAIHLALKALGIGRGDEVIVPDLTFAATINTVFHSEATPVIVDVEEDSWCIDPKEIEKAITPKTKAIIPVHLYGQPCDMDAIMAIAKKHNLYVIEDCAEAHGAMYNGKKVGSIGHIGCFSFFANKVITTGEGGMCTTNDFKLMELMKVMRDHGMNKSRKYYHEVIGFNYRMTNLQAAIGVAQLERIDEFLQQRIALEQEYRTKLSTSNIIEFQRNDLGKRQKITWLVSILVKDNYKDLLVQKLKEKGIDVRPFFISLGEMEIYTPYVFSNTVSIRLSKTGLNLPTSLETTERVIDTIQEVVQEIEGALIK
ncbi:MAG: aminotransferase class I/II-fold pyridoxal phosphate-dependent enzyme [Bacteroidetes bacterium]|nr:aminotransferase class I/II-fold pyridoxal phosphate-dependent enzyme [Bacteroidota bacterium]